MLNNSGLIGLIMPKGITNVSVVDEVKFIIKKGLKFNNPIIIEGFQGVGLVGTLTAQYLAQKNGFELIGHVDSEGIPPMALLVGGDIRNPIKIHANKKRDVIIIESELSIPKKIIYELSREITAWAKKINAKEIICLEGFSVPEEERDYEIFGMSTDKKIMDKLTKKGIKRLDSGIVIGMSAALLLSSRDQKIPATCLMIESRKDFPDGYAAAELLNTLAKIYNFKIDVEELKSQAEKFEKKIKQVISHARKLRDLDGKLPERETKMYG
jgi:uncharacterized protein